MLSDDNDDDCYDDGNAEAGGHVPVGYAHVAYANREMHTDTKKHTPTERKLITLSALGVFVVDAT